MSVEDLNLIIEQYMESEIECCKSRNIYSALENIVIRKDYLQNLDPISQLDEMKISDSTTSNSRLLKNKSLTKVTNVNKSKNAHTSTPDNKQFILVQKQIQQFESYKNCIDRVSDKYCTEFLHLLEIQNRKLSQSTKSKHDG